MTRRLEIVKNNGNHKSKFTVTPERLTIKLRDEDLNKEAEIVALGQKIASQIPLDEQSLRGSLTNGVSHLVKMNSKRGGMTYAFERSTGHLIRIRRGEGYLRRQEEGEE